MGREFLLRGSSEFWPCGFLSTDIQWSGVLQQANPQGITSQLTATGHFFPSQPHPSGEEKTSHTVPFGYHQFGCQKLVWVISGVWCPAICGWIVSAMRAVDGWAEDCHLFSTPWNQNMWGLQCCFCFSILFWLLAAFYGPEFLLLFLWRNIKVSLEGTPVNVYVAFGSVDI